MSIAVLGRPRGNRGELTATSLSSKPGRFARLSQVRLAGIGSLYDVEQVWEHDGALIFKFRGIDSISQAEELRGEEVQVPLSDRVELDPGEYFHSDLVGCEVREQGTGRTLGRVTAVEEYGGPALLEIDAGRLLIPFNRAICTAIRPGDRLIEVDLPEGLEELGKA